jgi:hypothetical protein
MPRGEKMAKQKGRQPFAAFHCERADYEFHISPERIRLDDFKREVERIVGENYDPDVPSFSGATTTRTLLDYHAHFRFRWTRKRFRATISYYEGRAEPRPGETGPFTEDIMRWFMEFVKDGQSDAELTVYFSYPMKRPKLCLPLPMRIPVGGQEVEVTGMVIRLFTKPEGAFEVFAGIHENEVSLGVTAERVVKLKEFDLRLDLLAMSSVAQMFSKEAQR